MASRKPWDQEGMTMDEALNFADLILSYVAQQIEEHEPNAKHTIQILIEACSIISSWEDYPDTPDGSIKESSSGDLGSGLGLNQISSPKLRALPDMQDENQTRQLRLRLKKQQEPDDEAYGPTGENWGGIDISGGKEVSSTPHIVLSVKYKWIEGLV